MNNTGKLVQVSMLSVIVMAGFMATMHSVAALNTNDVLPNISGAVSASVGDNLSGGAGVSVGDNTSSDNPPEDQATSDDDSLDEGTSGRDNASADEQESLEVTAANNTGGDKNDEENSSDNRTYISGNGNTGSEAMNATDYGNVANMTDTTNTTDADYNNSTGDDNESSEAGLSIEENERTQTGLLAEINARLSDIRSLLASIVARIGVNNDSNSSAPIDANSTNVTNMTGNVSMPVVEVNQSISENESVGNGSNGGNNDSIMESSVVGIEINRGVGWSMNEDDQASFTRFASSKQAFIDSDGETGYSSGLAILQLEDEEYGLVMDESESNDTAQVYRMAANDSGMLLLQQRLTAGSFATWQGTFTNSDGDSYNVDLVTMKRNIELSPSGETGDDSASSSNLSIQENSTSEFQEEFNRIASAEIMNTT